MLIVARRKGQGIVIGHDIEIVVTSISRAGVKLGVRAPNSLSILRSEVKEAVEQANREALLSEIADPELLARAALEPRETAAAEPTRPEPDPAPPNSWLPESSSGRRTGVP